MQNDDFLDFQRTAAADQAITVTALSGDWIDQLAKRDIGAGGGLCIATHIGTTFTAQFSSEACTTVAATDEIEVTSGAHGLLVGQPIVIDTLATTTGVTEGTIYYVTYNDTTDATAFAVASTLANALAGTVVTLTTNGTLNFTTLNTLEVQLVMGWDEAGTLDPANSEGFQVIGTSGPITIRETRNVTFDETGGTFVDLVALTGHGMSTGTPIVFGGAGTMPTGLAVATRYYVIWNTNDNEFQVASSLENARAGVRVEFTGDGSGELNVKIDDDQLTAGGPLIITEINPLSEDIGERYLRMRYLAANGALVAGKVRSRLVMTPDLGQKRYPTGWAVA